MDESAGPVVGIRARGTLTQDDYDALLPHLRVAIEEHGQIRALLKIEDFEGIEPAALWEEITFDVEELRHVERLAVVGDAAWKETLEKIAAPFVEAEVRFFEPHRRQDAWQ